MKKIINQKIFDTDKAEYFGRRESSSSCKKYEEHFYRHSDGDFFKEERVANSFNNHFSNLVIISTYEIKNFLEKVMSCEDYQEFLDTLTN